MTYTNSRKYFPAAADLFQPQNAIFFFQPALLQQLTAKRLFTSGFPYMWRDNFSPPGARRQKSKNQQSKTTVLPNDSAKP
jgi:hypothetical protein